MHDRIADEYRVQDIVRINLRLRSYLSDQIIDSATYCLGQQQLSARVHHHIGDPAHQIFTVADLRVHHARRGNDRAGRQIAKMHSDGCRADIDGYAIGLVIETGPGFRDPGPAMNGDGHIPVSRPQRFLKRL